jgi:DNA-directed RNA polymerase subunit RPC12/RpoP
MIVKKMVSYVCALCRDSVDRLLVESVEGDLGTNSYDD